MRHCPLCLPDRSVSARDRLAAKCSRAQHRRLDEISGWSAEMYNALLESWKGTCAWWREHHPADGTLVEIRVVRTPLRVELHAVFRYAQVPEPTGEPTNPVGIDKGLTTRLAFCDGRYVAARTVDNTTVRRYQRSLARAKKGSRSRAKKRAALARVQRRETERVRAADFRLAHSHDGIAVEELNAVGLLRSRRFSKKMSEQRWSALDAISEHKAGKAGVHYVRDLPLSDAVRAGYRSPNEKPVGGLCGSVQNWRGAAPFPRAAPRGTAYSSAYESTHGRGAGGWGPLGAASAPATVPAVRRCEGASTAGVARGGAGARPSTASTTSGEAATLRCGYVMLSALSLAGRGRLRAGCGHGLPLWGAFPLSDVCAQVTDVGSVRPDPRNPTPGPEPP